MAVPLRREPIDRFFSRPPGFKLSADKHSVWRLAAPLQLLSVVTYSVSKLSICQWPETRELNYHGDPTRPAGSMPCLKGGSPPWSEDLSPVAGPGMAKRFGELFRAT